MRGGDQGVSREFILERKRASERVGGNLLVAVPDSLLQEPFGVICRSAPCRNLGAVLSMQRNGGVGVRHGGSSSFGSVALPCRRRVKLDPVDGQANQRKQNMDAGMDGSRGGRKKGRKEGGRGICFI